MNKTIGDVIIFGQLSLQKKITAILKHEHYFLPVNLAWCSEKKNTDAARTNVAWPTTYKPAHIPCRGQK